MSSQTFLRLLRSRAPQIRSFSQSPFLQVKSSKPPAASFKYKPQPSSPPSKGTPAKSIPPALKDAAGRGTAPAANLRVQAPQPQPRAANAIKDAAASAYQKYAFKYLRDGQSLLLWKAPNHIGLFLSCVAIGGGLFFWIATVANGVFINYTAPWYAKFVILAGCAAVSAIGFAIILTPWNMVKTISIVRTAENKAMLRLQGTRFFPFQNTTVDVLPGQATIGSELTSTLANMQKICFTVPIENGAKWTAGEIPRPDTGSGLVNTWPNTKKHVKKMFNRENIAYIRFGNLNWKMDLEGCETLEGGQVLSKLVQEGAVKQDVVSTLARGLWGKV